jgi:hypothetical protein
VSQALYKNIAFFVLTSACSSIVQALYVNTFVLPETMSFTLKESVAHHLHM